MILILLFSGNVVSIINVYSGRSSAWSRALALG